MLLEQLALGNMLNFCYILACEQTGEAAIIDPGAEGDRILARIREQDLSLKYILNTHFHFDHTDFTEYLRQRTGAESAMHVEDIPYFRGEVDIALHDGDILQVGAEIELQVIHTPGHTPGGVCVYTQGRLFTGDTLFVGDSGRTDLPHGHRPTLGASIRRIMELPEDTIVLPGHDYGSTPTSTLRQEMRQNVNAVEYGFYKP